MNIQEANISDIVRCSQRDETFTNELQDYLLPLLRVFERKTYHQLRRYIPPLSVLWYYCLTSLGNLQTLGEEYTGLIRTCENKLPSKITNLLWLLSFIGGEAAFDATLQMLRKKVLNCTYITETAKIHIVRQIDFMKDNKHIFIRTHHSIFYINGRYQSISNRSTRLRYVLTRDWLTTDKNIPRKSLRLLGYISLFYLVFNMIQKGWSIQQYTAIDSVSANGEPIESSSCGKDKVRTKICTLCVDDRRRTSVTPCGHMFCWHCIHDSLRYQSFCPICRESVNSSRIVLLQNYR